MELDRLTRLLIMFSTTLMAACFAVGIFEHEWLLITVGLIGLIVNGLLWKYVRPTL